MSEVMRPKWLENKGILVFVVMGWIILSVVVPIFFISLPVVGYFVALGWGKLIGEIIGEGATKHWLATLTTVTAFVVVPIILQMIYGWLAGNWLMFVQSWVMIAACYWAGFLMGQNDDREEIAKTKRLLGIS